MAEPGLDVSGDRDAPGDEPVIDPAATICDAHHHLWDRPDQRYLLPELLVDLQAGHRVCGTVFVEWRSHYRADGPLEMRPVGETVFASAVAAKAEGGAIDVCAGIVGYADLARGRSAAAVLEAHIAAGNGRFKGVRNVAAWDPDPEVMGGPKICDPGLYLDARFREGFALLGEFGLTFDAWLYQTQLDDLIDLAHLFPAQAIVLNHTGGVLGVGRYSGQRQHLFAQWHRAIRELAKCPNVHMKLGGLGMRRSGFGFHGQAPSSTSAELADAWRPWLETCITEFGAERCMFESNFPVDGASCTYRVLWNTFKRIAAGASEAERNSLLHDTSVRFYRIA